MALWSAEGAVWRGLPLFGEPMVRHLPAREVSLLYRPRSDGLDYQGRVVLVDFYINRSNTGVIVLTGVGGSGKMQRIRSPLSGP
jgi:hypothetical protein